MTTNEAIKLIREHAVACVQGYRTANESTRLNEAKVSQQERRAASLLLLRLTGSVTEEQIDEAMDWSIT